MCQGTKATTSKTDNKKGKQKTLTQGRKEKKNK